MAYYLGRDIDIAITTEDPQYSIGLVKPSGNEQTAGALDHRETKGSDSTQYVNATHGSLLFAGPLAQGADTSADDNDPWNQALTGDATPLKAEAWSNVPSNITGLDLSFGVMDEDVAFVGQRSVLKAEIKKDNSVTLTRKKSDSVWSVIYNDARFGLADPKPTDGYKPLPSDSPNPFHDGLSAPDYVTCGYRVYLRFGPADSTGETFILRNCYVTDYSVTLGADSSQEESLTLQSYIDPIIFTGAVDEKFDTPTDAGEL
tara:strand:+ start:13 stop:789 length:777 start_codon:yes stop_codon:yes gene_type:complete